MKTFQHWQESCLHAAESSFGRLLQPLRSTDTTTVTISSETCCVEKRKALLQQRGRQALHRQKAYLQAGKVPSEWPGAAHTVRAEERRLLIDSHGRRTKCKGGDVSGAGLFFFGSNRQKTIILRDTISKKRRTYPVPQTPFLITMLGALFFRIPISQFSFGRPVRALAG